MVIVCHSVALVELIPDELSIDGNQSSDSLRRGDGDDGDGGGSN